MFSRYWLLQQAIERVGVKPDKSDLVSQARKLLAVPDEVSKDLTHFTQDPRPILAHRDRIARMIERLNRALSSVADRASCSSLCLYKQPTETAFKTIAEMGYPYVDLSCLNWAPHVSVPKLTDDFETEAARVETVLSKYGLRVSNLTFDAVESRPFDVYRKAFSAVVKLALRLNAPLINLMAPSANSDRADQVEKLRQVQAIAARSGVILTVETHCNQITERPADAQWICQQVPGLGLALDPSHYFAGPNQGANFDDLLPRVKGTGFRAGGMDWSQIQMPWGEGPIDFAALVKKMESTGYRGFYVCEYIEDFNTLDAVEELRKFLEWAKGLSARASDD